MKKALLLALSLLLLLYPVLIYVGIKHIPPGYIMAGVTLALGLRFVIIKQSTPLRTQCVLFLPVIAGVIVTLLGLLFNPHSMIRLYPAMMNGVFLAIFSYSLYSPPSFITQLAQRLSKQALPAEAVLYTRKVTAAWCVFFIFNGAIALWTALFSSLEAWTLYNGLIAYLLMGAFFVVEFGVRFFVKKRYERSLVL